MKKKATQKRPEKAVVTREDRLKAALKANLQRRKVQARSRGDVGVADKEA